jgi:hypothetical protein
MLYLYALEALLFIELGSFVFGLELFEARLNQILSLRNMQVFVFVEDAIFKRQLYCFFLHLEIDLRVMVISIEELRYHREIIEISDNRAHQVNLTIHQ